MFGGAGFERSTAFMVWRNDDLAPRSQRLVLVVRKEFGECNYRTRMAAFSVLAMRWAFSAAARGTWHSTDPAAAVTLSDLRRSRRAIDMNRLLRGSPGPTLSSFFLLQIAFLSLV